MLATPHITEWCPSQTCVDPVWEAAYNRFESPEAEMAKFRARFRKLGVGDWPRDAAVVNLFCGSGRELAVLHEMGFTRLEGVDLSRDLLERCETPASLYVGDCTRLQFADSSKDFVVIQGGLHHLPRVPEDVELCLREVVRVLRPDGRFLMIEPWWTPFLRFVTFVHNRKLPRKLYPRLDALAVMVEREAETYFNWLGKGPQIEMVLNPLFHTEYRAAAWGKYAFVGRPKKNS